MHAGGAGATWCRWGRCSRGSVPEQWHQSSRRLLDGQYKVGEMPSPQLLQCSALPHCWEQAWQVAVIKGQTAAQTPRTTCVWIVWPAFFTHYGIRTTAEHAHGARVLLPTHLCRGGSSLVDSSAQASGCGRCVDWLGSPTSSTAAATRPCRHWSTCCAVETSKGPNFETCSLNVHGRHSASRRQRRHTRSAAPLQGRSRGWLTWQ